MFCLFGFLMFTVWDEVILALDNASENKYTTAQTYSYVNLAHTIAASQDWSGCRELAAQFLARQRYGVVEFTDDCLTPPGSPEWATDPCCNTAYVSEPTYLLTVQSPQHSVLC